MHGTFKTVISVVDKIQTAWKESNIIRKLSTGQYVPTWAKTEGTGRQGKPTFQHPWSGEEMWLDAHVAQIKPTTGLGTHAILCPPPHSSYPEQHLLPCPPSFKDPLHLVVVHLLWVADFPTMPFLLVFPRVFTDAPHILMKIMPFLRHRPLFFFFFFYFYLLLQIETFQWSVSCFIKTYKKYI